MRMPFPLCGLGPAREDDGPGRRVAADTIERTDRDAMPEAAE